MGTVSQASLNMKAFVIVALVAAVAGEADPYTIGQVLAGQTNGGVLTSTTYHGGVKVEGFPYTKAVLPAVTYAGWPYAHAGVLYGKREAEAEPWTVGQIAAGAHVAEAIKDGRPLQRWHLHQQPWRRCAVPQEEGGRGRPRPGLQHRWRRALHLWRPPLRRRPRHQPRPRRCLHRRWPHPLLQRRDLHQLPRCRCSLLII